MPTYIYRRGDKRKEIMLPMSKATETLKMGKHLWARDYAAEFNGRVDRNARARKGRHYRSVAAGIGVSQVAPDGKYKDPVARDKFPKHKFDTKTGDMLFSSVREKHKQCSELGLATNS